MYQQAYLLRWTITFFYCNDQFFVLLNSSKVFNHIIFVSGPFEYTVPIHIILLQCYQIPEDCSAKRVLARIPYLSNTNFLEHLQAWFWCSGLNAFNNQQPLFLPYTYMKEKESTYPDMPLWSAYHSLIRSSHISGVIWYWSITLWGKRSSLDSIPGL